MFKAGDLVKIRPNSGYYPANGHRTFIIYEVDQDLIFLSEEGHSLNYGYDSIDFELAIPHINEQKLRKLLE